MPARRPGQQPEVTDPPETLRHHLTREAAQERGPGHRHLLGESAILVVLPPVLIREVRPRRLEHADDPSRRGEEKDRSDKVTGGGLVPGLKDWLVVERPFGERFPTAPSLPMLTVSGPPALSPARQLDLLMPLVFFYERAGVPLPGVDFLAGDAVPEPWRYLLVHQSDMTPRLRDYHGRAPVLQVITVERTPDYVLREVVLSCSGHPVEYGAIGIQLEGFPRHVQEMIREGVCPLGAILETEGVPHSSAPTGYFGLAADPHMAELLATTPGVRLFGRCNVLSHPDGTAFADIVEVLPPG